MALQVRKKDGRVEVFDRNKMLNGILKSGASQPEAEGVTAQVEAWAPTVAQAEVIGTPELRNKVLELLRSVNPTAAAAFESYQKSAGQSVPPQGTPPAGSPPVPPAGGVPPSQPPVPPASQ